jgi:hypothetical protein
MRTALTPTLSPRRGSATIVFLANAQIGALKALANAG